MKFKYMPGMRPTPMLMYQTVQNNDVFNENLNAFKQGEYINNLNHMWNIGSYIIYDNDLKVVSYRISDVNNLLWLLRALNKEVVIDFDEDLILVNKKFIENLSNSKEIIKI